MKKHFRTALVIISIIIQLTTVSCAEDSNARESAGGNRNTDNIIALPEVGLEGMSSLEAMERIRESISLSDESVGLDVVSELLWAAHGVTSTGRNTTTHKLDGVSGATLNTNKRYTFPVANSRRFINTYYISADGVFEYDPDNHSLIRLSDANLIDDMGDRVSDATGRIVLAMDSDIFTQGEN